MRATISTGGYMENAETQRQLSFCGAYWHYAPDDARATAIARDHHLSLELATCLSHLSLEPGDSVRQFLSPSLDHLYDPMMMLGMDKAIARFRRAIARGESIRVVTDYDVDGTMSSLILQSVLRICGHTRFSYHIPDRKIEGYGFSMAAAQKAIDDGIDLIVTADIGVRDERPIALARAHGIDVIILDHHLPVGEGVPPSAYAVLCPPQAGCPYPNKSLAACGISLKFAQALLKDHAMYPLILRSLTKLAAMGTVADVVSLLDPENRAIVAVGLDALNHDNHKPGLAALLNVSQVMPGTIDSSSIGYRIGPRINAAGRLASATLVIDLLHAPNSVMAHTLAGQLDAMNAERQEIQEEMVRTALEMTRTNDDPFVVVALEESPSWHSGVAGIVAGRLREQLHHPVAVCIIENGMVTGSIRSTLGVHAVQALTSIESLMTKFGGHAAAAGFSFPAENLDAFRKGLCENAILQLQGHAEIPVTDVALCVEPRQIRENLFEDMARLEPCGSQNPRPLVCIRNAKLSRMRLLKEKHLRMTIEETGIPLSGIWFSAPVAMHDLPERCHLLGELQKEIWNGEVRYQICVRDACPADRDVFVTSVT